VLHTLAPGIRIEEEARRIAREAVRMLEEGERHIEQEVVHILAGEEHRIVVKAAVAHKAVERELHKELVDRSHLAGRMVVDWEEGIAVAGYLSSYN